MRNQEEITKAENERPALECQYAARYYFNAAEKFFTLALIVSFISVLAAFIPSTSSAAFNIALSILSVLCDAVVILLTIMMHKAVEKAATLRNYFDRIVFNLEGDNSSEDMHRTIREWIQTAIYKNLENYKLQIQNSGRDTPPGVKNWYEFSKDFPGNEAVHECQRQNVWWDKKQSKCRLAILVILILCAIVMLLLYARNGASPLKILICAISIIVVFSDHIQNYYTYIKQSYILEGASIEADYGGNIQQIIHVQELIEQRRKIPILGINLIHAHSSKKLSEQYEEISKG